MAAALKAAALSGGALLICIFLAQDCAANSVYGLQGRHLKQTGGTFSQRFGITPDLQHPFQANSPLALPRQPGCSSPCPGAQGTFE